MAACRRDAIFFAPTIARSRPITIFVDADACPVKDEIYRVAARYALPVIVVSNGWLRVPQSPLIELVVVSEGLDRADDLIALRAGPGDICVTADVPLADRCIKKGAQVVAPSGRVFTTSSIGADLATRNLLTALRETGQMTGGSRPFGKQDRSRFLQALDAAVQASRRAGRPAPGAP